MITGLLEQHGELKKGMSKKLSREPIRFAQKRRLPTLYDGAKETARREALEIARTHGLDTNLTGYKIVTTFSPTVQRAIVDAVVWRFTKIPRYTKKDTVEAGCAAVCPQDGRILGLVGDARPLNYSGDLNHATTDRNSVGSSFKPFDYAAFFANGHGPEDMVSDAPGNPYNPGNFGGSTPLGNITARFALSHSINKAAANLVNSGAINTAQVIAILRAAGFTGRLHTEPAMLLGIDDASPLQMAMLYSIFPNGGRRVTPYCIQEIRNEHDSVIYRHQSGISPRVLSAQVAADIISCLKGVVAPGGTAASIRNYYQGTVAGKTGTTQVAQDAWFTGFTSKMVISTWIGTRHNGRLPKGFETGGHAAAPLFGKALQNIQHTGSDYYLKANF